VRGLSIREIHRRTGIHCDTISRALRSDEPPRYERAPRGSKLDPFKDEIHRLQRKATSLMTRPLGKTVPGRRKRLRSHLVEAEARSRDITREGS
jgi:hypothetical protein